MNMAMKLLSQILELKNESWKKIIIKILPFSFFEKGVEFS